MSFVLLGILNSQAAGAGGIGYYLSALGDTEVEEGLSVALDSSNNVYAAGWTNDNGVGDTDALLVKYDSSAVVQWQRTLADSSNNDGYGVAVDSADNVYLITEEATSDGIILAKYDSSGTIQWQKGLSGGSSEKGYGIATDSSNNVYLIGNTTSSGEGSDDLLIAKYNSSGTIQWQRTLGGASGDTGYAITVDSSDNIYVTGLTESSGEGSNDILIAKYNTSGSLQWQRTLGDANGQYASAIAHDSSGNVYVFAHKSDELVFNVAKYNSSGTLQWQRTLTDNNFNTAAGIAVDSADNVYVLGRTNNRNFDFFFAKYNSSGTIQWQRTFGDSANDEPGAIAIDSDDNLYLIGETSFAGTGSNNMFLAKLPNDGSLTGTYSFDGRTIYYEVSTFTDAAGSLTSATSSLTDSSSSLTSSTSSLTSASASFPVVTEEIG